MRRTTLLMGSVAFLLVLPPWAWAGWELQLREERRGRSREARVWVDARYGMRQERQGGRRTIIMRTDRELTYVLRHRRRSYFEQSWADLRKLQERAAQLAQKGGVLERMEEMLKSAPPEQRARLKRRLERLRRALRPPGETKVRVRPTGQKKTLHGFAVEEVVVEEGGRTHTFWVSREERLAPLAEVLAQMAEKMAEALRGPLGVSAFLQARRALFRELKGVPIRSEVHIQILGEERKYIREVTSARERGFSLSDFEPPSGYEKVKGPFPVPEGMRPSPPGARSP